MDTGNEEIVIENPEEINVESKRKKISYKDSAQGVQEIYLEPVTKQQLSLVLQKLEGTIFKMEDLYFKVTYLNEGQGRFTATCINHVD